MARHSEVLIQGTDVPGLRMVVTVPVDHTYASDTARSIYNFGGNTQYIWRKSWETDQPAPRGGGGSSDMTGDLADAVFGLAWGLTWGLTKFTVLTAWELGKVTVKGTVATTKVVAPVVWKGYTKAIQGTEWVLANTR